MNTNLRKLNVPLRSTPRPLPLTAALRFLRQFIVAISGRRSRCPTKNKGLLLLQWVEGIKRGARIVLNILLVNIRMIFGM